MTWKVAIMGPVETVYKNTNTFSLLYPFPTKQEAEKHANCLRVVGMNVVLLDEWGNKNE